jgi:hypothetical protein
VAGAEMRGLCEIAKCSNPKEGRKIHEDFEALNRNVCWECGEKLITQIFDLDMDGFKKVLRIVESELD